MLAGIIDMKKFKKHDIFRTIACLLEMLSQDEATQVNGIVKLVDFTGMTIKHQTFMSLEDRKAFLQTWQVRMTGIAFKRSSLLFLFAIISIGHNKYCPIAKGLQRYCHTLHDINGFNRCAPNTDCCTQSILAWPLTFWPSTCSCRFPFRFVIETLPYAHQEHSHLQWWGLHGVCAGDHQVCHDRKNAEKSKNCKV